MTSARSGERKRRMYHVRWNILLPWTYNFFFFLNDMKKIHKIIIFVFFEGGVCKIHIIDISEDMCATKMLNDRWHNVILASMWQSDPCGFYLLNSHESHFLAFSSWIKLYFAILSYSIHLQQIHKNRELANFSRHHVAKHYSTKFIEVRICETKMIEDLVKQTWFWKSTKSTKVNICTRSQHPKIS